MTVSTNMKRIQKTKDLDYFVEVGVETRGKQGVYSDLMTMSNPKAKSEINTGNHCSVMPTNPFTMSDWIASKDNADANPHPYTVILKSIVWDRRYDGKWIIIYY